MYKATSQWRPQDFTEKIGEEKEAGTSGGSRMAVIDAITWAENENMLS